MLSDIQLPPYVDFDSSEYKRYLDGFRKYLSMESFQEPTTLSYDLKGDSAHCHAKDILFRTGGTSS